MMLVVVRKGDVGSSHGTFRQHRLLMLALM